MGPLKSSVFPAPVRAALTANSYEMACIESERICGKKISKQTFGLLARIRYVDILLRESPALINFVYEVHPEVCFVHLNGRQPLKYPKKSGFGFIERITMVEKVFGSSPYDVRAAVPRNQASDDDILDAFVALWTAQRIHDRTAVPISEVDDRDAFGLPMQMWV